MNLQVFKQNSLLSKQPLFWYTDNEDSRRGECDCACSNAITRESLQNAILNTRWMLQSEKIREIRIGTNLYSELYQQNNILIGSKSKAVLVVNHPVYRFLQTIHRPVDFNTLRKQFSQWSDNTFYSVIGILFLFDVLSSSSALANKGLAPIRTLSAWLNMTNQCNLSCSYCFVQHDNQRMNTDIALRSVDAIFRSALAHGYEKVKMKYAGGEPTLNFEVLLKAQERAEVLSKKTGLGLEAVLLTNGIHMTDEYIDHLLDHNINVMVSLDGMNNFHDQQRSAKVDGLSYSRTIQTIDRLVQRDISPYISITVTNQSVDGLPQLTEFLLKKGLRFGLNFYREPYQQQSSTLKLNNSKLIDGLFRTLEVIKQQLPRYSLLSSLGDRADLQFPHEKACGSGESYMVINCDGYISNCQMEMQFPVTTIDADEPLKILRSNSRIVNLSVDQKECQDCIWRYRCAGGCPRETHQTYGRFDARSPLCDVYQAIFPEIVRLEAMRLLKYEAPWDYGIQ